MTLSPFLFILILDTLTEEIRTSAPLELVFADDIVLIGKMEEELKEKLVKWQRELANGGLRMSVEKSVTMVMETSQETEIRTKDMNGKDMRQGDNFKYLGMEIESEEGTLRAVKQRIKVAWMKWCEMAGVICDKGMSNKVKSKI